MKFIPISDEQAICNLKEHKKDTLGNLVAMYKIRRQMGESIQEAFDNVKARYLEILINAVTEFDAKANLQ